MINAHTHIFTIDHVPNKFARGMVPLIGGLVTIKLVKWIWRNRKSPFLRVFRLLFKPLVLGVIIGLILRYSCGIEWIYVVLLSLIFQLYLNQLIIRFLDGKPNEMVRRYVRLLDFSYKPNSKETYEQKDIFQRLKNYYPSGTQFVALTMDMTYMGGGKPLVDYQAQLSDIENLAQSDATLFPFICVDPRRLSDANSSLDLKGLQKKIDDGLYKGIKLYPALGYYPFDWRLLPIYEKAIVYDLPIMSHCSHGPVYSRNAFDKKVNGKHPFSGMTINKKVMKGRHQENFTVHFTDPVNYQVAVNPDYLKHYLEQVDQTAFSELEQRLWSNHIVNLYTKETGEFDTKKLKKFSNLKFCLAHWGGGEEWDRYLEDYDPALHGRVDPMKEDLRVAHNHEKTWETYSWFTLIRELIQDERYNFYTDISFTLHEEKYLNLLKVHLMDPRYQRLKERVLFGTDFYVVSHKETEREFSVDVKGALGAQLWNQISSINPNNYL